MKLVYVVTENYLERATACLDSCGQVSADRFLICYKFQPTEALRQRFPHLHLVHMPETPFECNNMVQHGGWLDVLPEFDDEELLVMSDADVVVQRGLDQAEIERFIGYNDNTMGLAWNAFPEDNLFNEAKRIGMTQERWMRRARCFNCGLIAGRVGSWRRFRQDFETDCLSWFPKSKHRCKIQWHLCHCLHRMGMQIDILPYSIHTHGHFPLPEGTEIRPDGAFHRNTKIVFRHRF